MALAHNVVSLICCVAAWVFFVIGCIGNSAAEDNVKNAPWIRADGTNFNLWVGAQGFVYDDGNTQSFTRFRTCESSISFCTPCKDNGRVTFALMCIAVIFALISVIFSGVNCGVNNLAIKYTALSTTGSSLVMAVVGWCVFMRRCYHHVDDAVSQDLYYGAGSAISLLGYLLMGIAFICNVLNVYYSTPVEEAK